MKFPNLERLYYDFSETEEYFAQFEAIHNKDVDREFDETVDRLSLSNEVRGELIDAVVSVGSENERTGFILGFRYAMNLLQECVMKL